MIIHSATFPGMPASTPDKRAAILESALTLMSERTFAGTPMPLVAERAAVGAGTIYRYFESKEALGNEVFRSCARELLQHLRSSGYAGGSLRQEFRGLWRGLWDFSQKHPAAFHFIENHHHASYLDPESQALADELLAFVGDFIVRAQRAGVVRDDPPILLIALAYGSFVGLNKAHAEGRLALDDATYERSERAVWDLLRAPSQREKNE
jgi:AcrR family transcriptional regulator